MTGYAAAETALVMFVLAVVATLTRRTLQPFTRKRGGTTYDHAPAVSRYDGVPKDKGRDSRLRDHCSNARQNKALRWR